jgi:hypothetical protein
MEMQLDLFTLARYAEAEGDLLNILGGGWDTIGVTQAPDVPPGAENAPAAVIGGALVARLKFHQITETNRNHSFSVTLVDEDGGEVGRMGGDFNVQRASDLPVGWPQNMNIVLPLGTPLPRFGAYTFSMEVDGQHLGDLAFRVVDQREGGAGQQAA